MHVFPIVAVRVSIARADQIVACGEGVVWFLLAVDAMRSVAPVTIDAGPRRARKEPVLLPGEGVN